MIARISIDPAEWPRCEGVLVDRQAPGGDWRNVGLYGLRPRQIDVEVASGDRLRVAGFRQGDVPQGAPAGVTALLLSDYLETSIA